MIRITWYTPRKSTQRKDPLKFSYWSFAIIVTGSELMEEVIWLILLLSLLVSKTMIMELKIRTTPHKRRQKMKNLLKSIWINPSNNIFMHRYTVVLIVTAVSDNIIFFYLISVKLFESNVVNTLGLITIGSLLCVTLFLRGSSSCLFLPFIR